MDGRPKVNHCGDTPKIVLFMPRVGVFWRLKMGNCTSWSFILPWESHQTYKSKVSMPSRVRRKKNVGEHFWTRWTYACRIYFRKFSWFVRSKFFSTLNDTFEWRGICTDRTKQMTMIRDPLSFPATLSLKSLSNSTTHSQVALLSWYHRARWMPRCGVVRTRSEVERQWPTLCHTWPNEK